ncbi:MAG: hypothetical protein AAFR83_25705, partial [Cyanobacteria bacterium J06629_18]
MDQQQQQAPTTTTTATSEIYQQLVNPANRWSPPPSPLPHRPTSQWSPSPPTTPTSTTNLQNLTSNNQPCTPIDLADIEQSELLLEPIESDESIASLTNNPTTTATAINNILRDVVQHYNQENNTNFTTPNQIASHNLEMKSETPSPIPTNTRNISTTSINQTNFQNAPMQLINPFLHTSNPPIPTPALTPTFQGFTPTSINSTIPTLIPINQLPQHTVIRPVTPRIP